MEAALNLSDASAITRVGNGATSWIIVFKRLSLQDVSTITYAIAHENNNIQQLYLWETEIGDEGAMILAESLAHKNCKTQHLNLKNNNIGDCGCKALTKAAFRNINLVLESLVIDNWEVEDVRSDRRVLNTLFALLSAREAAGQNNNTPITRLPTELIRMLAGMMRIEQRDDML